MSFTQIDPVNAAVEQKVCRQFDGTRPAKLVSLKVDGIIRTRNGRGKYGAVKLNETLQTFDLRVSAIIWATGWKPYDASKITPYSYDQSPDIVTNVEMERLSNLAHWRLNRSSFRRSRREKNHHDPVFRFARHQPLSLLRTVVVW